MALSTLSDYQKALYVLIDHGVNIENLYRAGGFTKEDVDQLREEYKAYVLAKESRINGTSIMDMV